MTKAGGLRITVLLLVLIALGIAGEMWRSREPRQAPRAEPDGGTIHGPALDRALESIDYGDRTAPRDRWDPAYVAERLGTDPMMHLQWVRERSVWIPYRGVLRGPSGVLMDGQGNSLDRALLLASLLTKAGHTVRLAHADIGDLVAAQLLPRLVAERREAAAVTNAASERDWQREVQQLASLHGFDSGRLFRSVSSRLEEVTGIFRELDARTAEQSRRLEGALPMERFGTGEPNRVAEALRALRDHWWVQVQEHGRWTDLDVLGEAAGGARVPAERTLRVPELDPALYHRVTIRVVTERVSRGTLAESRALEHTIRTADLPAGPVTVQVMPESWRPGVPLGADRRAAFSNQMRDEVAWRAALTIGKSAVAQAVIESSGKAGSPQGDGFGGLGGAIAGGLGKKDRSDSELSAAWLEYETFVPGRPATIVRRQLFDLVGPAARSSERPVELKLDDARRLERSLALFRSTDILPLGSAVAPTYLAHLAAKAVLANGALLRTPAESAGATPAAVLDRLNELATPLPSPLYALAIARMPGALERDIFLDRPNILTRHDFLARRSEGIQHVAAVDIVSNDVGVALDAPNAAAARRRQGVRDTNAEALVYGTPGPLGSVAEAYAAGGKWVTVTSPSDGILASLSPDLRTRIADDVRAGHVVVVPTSVAAAHDPAATGWWRIDSVTGGTLGVSGTGWGQSAVEKAAIIMGAVAVAWTWEYLICSGSLYVPGGNQTVSRAEWPLEWFATPLHAGATVADHCIFDAWVAGITAGVFHSMTICWPFFVNRFPWLKFFEKPMFATGEGSPGDLPPIFGKPPAQAPPKECPPAGAPPAAAEGPPPEPEPPVPGGAPKGKTAPGAEEPVPPEEPFGPQQMGKKPGDHAPIEADDWVPMKPEEMAERVSAANTAASEAGAKIGPAKARYGEAQAAVQEAEAELAAADAAAKTDPSLEASQRWVKAGEDLTKAQVRAHNAYKDLNALENAQQMADRQAAMQPLNDELYQAREQVRLTGERFSQALQQGQADFNNSPEYLAWRQAADRYADALQKYGAAQFGKLPPPPANAPSPQSGTAAMPDKPVPGPGQTKPLESPGGPAGPGQTQPLGNKPVGPGQTQPLGKSPAGPGQTQPLGNSPTCPGAASPPPGSPPPGSSPPGAQAPKPWTPSPLAKPAGKAPAGKGPFQGDPETRQWLKENWSPDPAQAHDAARPLGDPAIYDNADGAALARYNEARAQGMNDQAARQESWDTWWNSVQAQRQARGIHQIPGTYLEWVGEAPASAPESHLMVGAGAIRGDP